MQTNETISTVNNLTVEDQPILQSKETGLKFRVNVQEVYMQLADIQFVQYRAFLIMHIGRQLLILFHVQQVNYQLNEMINGVILFIMFTIMYIQFDLQLQFADLEIKKKDLKIMKVLHDLKNPVLALISTINDNSLDMKAMQSIANADLEDIDEMIDNLKTEFKLRYKMDCKEDKRDIATHDFMENLGRAQLRLAKNGNNDFQIYADQNVPEILRIPKICFQRISYNLISNAMKHTNNGFVRVNLKIATDSDLVQDKFIHKGNDYDPSLLYIMLEVKDNGSGIPKHKINKIFDIMNTDSSNTNFDGTGLGMGIVLYQCTQINGFIRYYSEVNHVTIFRFQQPLDTIQMNNSKQVKRRRQSKTVQSSQDEIKIKHEDHMCQDFLIAEDNPSILKKQEKQLNKLIIKQKSFENGLSCYNQLDQLNCPNCKNILLITDLSMPYKDGIQLVQGIKDSLKHLNITSILVSAEEQNNDLDLFSDVQLKPLPLKKLKELYEKFKNK